MNHWVLFVSWIALMSLNALDAVMTRTAVRKGHPELNKRLKDAIDKYGLDGALLRKALVPTPLVILVILGWNSAVIGIILIEVAFSVPIIYYVYVFFHNFSQLLKSNQAPRLA